VAYIRGSPGIVDFLLPAILVLVVLCKINSEDFNLLHRTTSCICSYGIIVSMFTLGVFVLLCYVFLILVINILIHEYLNCQRKQQMLT